MVEATERDLILELVTQASAANATSAR